MIDILSRPIEQGEIPREYILSHGELSKRKETEGSAVLVNSRSFITDRVQDNLRGYDGTYVVYWKGVLCGQSESKEEIFDRAQKYYGHSNLCVFHVPEIGERVSFEDALDEFGEPIKDNPKYH